MNDNKLECFVFGACLLLFSSAASAQQPSAAQIRQVDEELAGMKKLMPIRTGQTQWLTDAYRIHTTLHYTMYEKLGPTDVTQPMRDEWAASYTKNVCRDSDTRALINAGFSITAGLVNERKVPVATVYVDAKSCR